MTANDNKTINTLAKACFTSSPHSMMNPSTFESMGGMRFFGLTLFLIAAGFFPVGCLQLSRSGDAASLPAPSHPEDSLLMPTTLPDPLEPVNRVTFAVDEKLFTLALEPAARGYNAVIPEPARVGLKNFRNNLFYPIRLGNNLLQGKWSQAGTDTKRFFINTTEGVLGLGDPASHKHRLAVSDEDLGQTLGVCGWHSKAYLYVPVLGASSERDLIGRAGDVFVDPASLVPPAKMGLEFNLLSFDVKATRKILETELDPYELNKMYYTQKRAIQVTDARPLKESDDSAQTQTLMVIFARREVVDRFPAFLDEYEKLLCENEIILSRTQGVGKLSRELAISAGITGPMLRASGEAYDLRKVDAYGIYDRFKFRVPYTDGDVGDCYDRFMVRMLEMRESVKILEQALADIPEGEIMGNAPRVFKPKPGEVYGRVEGPKGELGFYLIADGTPKPYRYRVRPPSLINLTVLRDMCLGGKIADAVIILGSIDIVLGEVDR